jgi:hypothetical protein
MAQELCVIVNDEDRAHLEAIIGGRNRPLKHVQRARIVLPSAERLPVRQVAVVPGSTVRQCASAAALRGSRGGGSAARQDPAAGHPVPIETVNRVLALTSRWVFHFPPTSGSWLNAVESFSSKITRQRIRRGVFRSIADFQTAINRYLRVHGTIAITGPNSCWFTLSSTTSPAQASFDYQAVGEILRAKPVCPRWRIGFPRSS